MKPDELSELIDDLFREKVLQARRESLEQKLLDGPRLFDYACRVAKDGIRSQFPDATEEAVVAMLKRRLEIARKLEEWP